MKKYFNLPISDKIYNTLFVLVSTAIVVFLYYINHFGLDFSDESFYALGFKYGIEPTHPSLFHRVYNSLFGFVNFKLLTIRQMRLFLTCSSSLFLTYAFLKYLKSRAIEIGLGHKTSIYSTIIVASLISYTFAPLTLSYNSLSAVFFFLLGGVWLLKIALKTGIKHLLTLGFLMGVLVGFMFYNKITNAILLFAALPILDFIVSFKKGWESKKNYLLYWITVSLGFGATIVLMRDYNFSITENFNRYFEIFNSENMDSTYSSSYLINNYFENFKSLIDRTSFSILIIGIGFSALYRFKNKLNEKRKNEWISILFLTVSVAFILLNHSLNGGTYRTSSIFEFHFFLLCFSFLWAAFHSKLMKNKSLILVAFTFLTIPFMGSVGTNNWLSKLFIYYMPFFYLAVFIFTLKAPLLIRRTILAAFLFVSFCQIYTANTKYPYRQKPIVPEEMTSIQSNSFLGGIRISEEHQKLIQEIDFVHNKGVTQILTYADLGGLGLLLNLKPFSFGWLRTGKDKFNCFVLGRAPNCNPKELVIIFPKSLPPNKALLDCLLEKGIDFKNDFELATKVNHYCYTYKKQQFLEVYLHKEQLIDQ